MKKIGILGGTFDPVHYGHIALAEDAVREAGLHEVVMIPARIQPFKQDREYASGEDRFNSSHWLPEKMIILPCQNTNCSRRASPTPI